MIDVGGRTPESLEDLQAGFRAVQAEFHEAVSWENLSRVVITHPHPDHVAGLPFVQTLTRAPVAAHVRAVPLIEHPRERVERNQALVEAQLAWAGITGDFAQRMRRRVQNVWLPDGLRVDLPVQDGDLLDDLFRVIYTPGHEGAQVCLQVHDVLFSADHLLPRNSPPLMPERWQAGAGLAHYLHSLGKMEALTGVNVALGGHDGPMVEWRSRIEFLRRRYDQKLQDTLTAAQHPRTIQELMHALNPRLNPLQAVLLLDQTAALVEYLVQQGQLTETLNEQGTAYFQAR